MMIFQPSSAEDKSVSFTAVDELGVHRTGSKGGTSVVQQASGSCAFILVMITSGVAYSVYFSICLLVLCSRGSPIFTL